MTQKIPSKSVVMLVLVVVAVSGCLGSVNADEVREDSLEAMETTDTYRFEMEMNMTLGGGIPEEFSLGMTGEGAVNESSDSMRMSSEVDMGEGAKQEVYVVNGTMYQNTGGEDAEWHKIGDESAVSRALNTSLPAGEYKELLEISEVSHEGTDTVDGEPAHVLRLEPEPDEYNELLQERLNGATVSGGAETPKLFGDDGATVEDASSRYWISKESGHVLRTGSEMTVSFGFGGEGTEELSATVELDVRMYDHGEDISVELPEAARDASGFGAGFEDDTDTVDAGTEMGEIPDESDVDRTTDGLIDRVESEVQESEAFGEMHTAKVYFEDSLEAETVAVEGLESDASAQTDSPGAVTFLSVVGVNEGEEVAVTATKEDGTVVRQTTTYEP